MDKLTVLGLLVGVLGILLGQILDGSHLGILFQGTAFLIVFGGTIGAVMVQSSGKVFMNAVRMLRWAFIPPKAPDRDLIRQLFDFGMLARRDGVLPLETKIPDISDPFLAKGVHLVVDGYTAAEIREVLEIDIESWEQLHWQSARVWESAAGYSPTIGIIGAVLGLMHVMQNLAEPSKLGAGIAVAFVATIYGVAFANLMFLPIANKLKAIIQLQTHRCYLIVDGLGAIANGENPRLTELRLESYLV